MSLSQQTQELVATIITEQCYSLRENEFQKQTLAKEDTFLLLNIFQRIDTKRQNNLETLDFVTFFRDNYLVVSEADCFLLVRANDSNADGMISLSDLMKMLLPNRYSTF